MSVPLSAAFLPSGPARRPAAAAFLSYHRIVLLSRAFFLAAFMFYRSSRQLVPAEYNYSMASVVCQEDSLPQLFIHALFVHKAHGHPAFLGRMSMCK